MAIWEKLFSKITFKNYPDTSTPINADNLNKMTDAIDGLDDRVVELNDSVNVISSDLTNKSHLYNYTLTPGDTLKLNLGIGTYLISLTHVASIYSRYDAIIRTFNTAEPYITEITPRAANSNIVLSYYVQKLVITNNTSGTLRISILSLWHDSEIEVL